MKISELLEKLYKIKISGVEIYPRDSIINFQQKKYSTKGICNIDDGSQGGTHWVAFNGSKYFDSFGGPPNKWLINQLPKPIIYHNYIIQGIHSKMCGTYCLYFLYLLENNVNYEDAVLNIFFS